MNKSLFAFVLAIALLGGTAFGRDSHQVTLGFLGSNGGNITLASGVETGIFQNDVYAPCHPLWGTMPNVSIRPISGCVDNKLDGYSSWEVELTIAPITVHNTGSGSVVLVVNVYSDNAYVYQQKATIPAGHFFPIYFGAQSLGFISSLPGSTSMPIAVTMTPTGNGLVVLLDTGAPATWRPGESYLRVSGFGIQMFPMD
jgi:hypothetical protein